MSTRPLFSPVELFDGFDPDLPGSYLDTLDFRTYLATKQPAISLSKRIAWAEQDQRITDARDTFLVDQHCVAIMGGHKVGRDEHAFRSIADLARRLARRNVIVTSGGGPGAMEATQLGAALADRPDGVLHAAIDHLASGPAFPSGMTKVVRADGTVDRSLIRRLHTWQAPAFTLLSELAIDGPLRPSLSVPTWFYGHEPPTPFATHIAKYISNALREDGLLAIARHGVVYAPGEAGTLQEVFQDAAQNAYKTHGWFSPMCFLDLPFQGVDQWWTDRFPVEVFLRPLFGDAAYRQYVCITSDLDEAEAFLHAFAPAADAPLPS